MSKFRKDPISKRTHAKHPLAAWWAATIGQLTIRLGRFQLKWARPRRKDKLAFKPGMRPTGLSALRRYSARYGSAMAEGNILLQQDNRGAWRYGRRSERIQSWHDTAAPATA